MNNLQNLKTYHQAKSSTKKKGIVRINEDDNQKLQLPTPNLLTDTGGPWNTQLKYMTTQSILQ